MGGRPLTRDPMALFERARAGDRRALARLISMLEDGGEAAVQLSARLFPFTGNAYVIGITGPPGSGKSTLVNALTRAYRERGETVGIVAVDPSSPFTGGALLGDRVRMQDVAGDPGVFIRSMATRGSLGGLARATREIIRALDAVGFHRILVETVGAGQVEVDIAQAADTVVVVQAPGLGDDIQAIKAGILEIADILVVNKADREGAAATLHILRSMLSLGQPAVVRHHGQAMAIQRVEPSREGWTPPILQTVATSGRGIPELVEAIERHRAYLEESGEGEARRRRRIAEELAALARERLWARVVRQVGRARLDGLVDQLLRREIDLHTAVERLLEDIR
ncbi:methylmalonyl Co-A mutase-associated GTPase MeaB [Thermoflexus sp.]|uniref:methylmalonyl Co-A mutase-associated GTPase MeaB n=1 Tax=Thermoflexus sp. TaxID=1969742 RepID=UPI002ADDE9F1|nr:methylmalonyl Co-A mutase-associated GTPase MeaB [Thermoflexus sp.]